MAADDTGTPLKQRFVAAINDMPDDVTFDEVIDKLLLIYKIEVGLEQVRQGRVTPHDEVMRRMAQW